MTTAPTATVLVSTAAAPLLPVSPLPELPPPQAASTVTIIATAIRRDKIFFITNPLFLF